MATQAQSPRAQTLRTFTALRDDIFKSFDGRQVFSPLPISACYDLAQQSVAQLTSSAAGKELRSAFVDAGFNAQVGYNQGSDLLSVFFPLPTLDQQRELQLSPKQAIVWAMLGLLHEQAELEDAFAALCEMSCAADRATSAAGPFVYSADELEQWQAAHPIPSESKAKEDAPASDARHSERERTLRRLLAGPSSALSAPLLANRCLRLFTDQARTAITERKVDLRLGTVTLIIRAARRRVSAVEHARSGPAPQLALLLHDEERPEGAKTAHPDLATPRLLADDSTPVLRYHAAYTVVSGADDAALAAAGAGAGAGAEVAPAARASYWSERVLSEQRTWLTETMVSAVWAYATDTMRYYPGKLLRQQVTEVLRTFIFDATQSVKAEFVPGRPLTLFLNGPPGTGKTRFVKVFSDSLQRVVSRVFEPAKRFETVRIPFNQTSPAALSTILMVRGISDWSIERIVEQTVCRGGICFLHLEEQPPQPQLQNELFALTSTMTRTLCGRYPEYRNNVINILTSNYPPSPEIAAVARVIDISPPTEETQREWCGRTLEDSISGAIQLVPVSRFRPAALSKAGLGLPVYASHPAPPPYFGRDECAPVQRKVAASALECESIFATYPSAAAAPAAAAAEGKGDAPARQLPVFIQYLASVVLEAAPPLTEDMRRLGTWKLSLSFAALQALAAGLPQLLSQIDLAAVEKSVGTHRAAVSPPSDGSPAAATAQHTFSSSYLQFAARVVVAPDSAQSATAPGAGAAATYPGICLNVSFTGVPSPNSQAGHQPVNVSLPPVRLATSDGFFYTPAGDAASATSASSHSRLPSLPPALANALPPSALQRVVGLTDMWISSFLKPTVLVLQGPAAASHAAAAAVRCIVHGRTRPATATHSAQADLDSATVPTDDPVPVSNLLRSDSDSAAVGSDAADGAIADRALAAATLLSAAASEAVAASGAHPAAAASAGAGERAEVPELSEFFARCRSDQDRRLLLGNPDPQNGLLMRFIHATNGETIKASASGSRRVGLITCAANGLGQFALREIIDAGQSSTHTTKLRKDGLLFVLVLDEGETLQPQLVSRAQEIITFA